MALKFPDILQHNNSNYALIDSGQLRGTAYTITNLSDTGSIPSDKRNVGIIVFVTSEKKYYGYYGTSVTITNWNNTSNWKALADGENSSNLNAITTGSTGVNQTISGSLTVLGGITASGSYSTQSLSSSFSSTASFTPNAVVTASAVLNTITFTKGDSSSFAITVNTGSNVGNLLGAITNNQFLYNNSNTFAGTTALVYNGENITATGSFTGSFSGSIFGTASRATTASLALTASYTNNSLTSSFPFTVTGSTIYSQNSNVFGNIKTNVGTDNNFIVGTNAGVGNLTKNSVFIGRDVGSYSGFYDPDNNVYEYISSSANNIFIGKSAGNTPIGITNSIFLMENSGINAFFTTGSIFIGVGSGYNARNANHAILLGRNAGAHQYTSSYSIFIGSNAGAIDYTKTTVAQQNRIGTNNIIIGNNVSLPIGTNNSINFGGIIFASGTYSVVPDFTNHQPRTTAITNGKVGINIYPNNYNFEVNGTANISNGIYVTNSINLSGSYTQIGNNYITGSLTITGSSNLIGTQSITGSLITSGSNTFYGSQSISGNLSILNDLQVFGTASFGLLSYTYTNVTIVNLTGSNNFGNSLDDTQSFTGSIILTGSLIVTGSSYLTASNVAGGQNKYIAIWNSNDTLTTGSLFETASNILIGTTDNTNLSDFKLYVSGNLGLNGYQISSLSSSVNPQYVGIWRPSGSSGNTNFLEISESNAQHSFVFRGIDGYDSVRKFTKNNSSIVNINLGWTGSTISTYSASTLLIDPTIDVANPNAMTIRGIYYNPKIKNIDTDVTHIALETSTGSIVFKNLPTSSTVSNILLYDSASGQLYYTASTGIGGNGTGVGFPFSGSAVITGSLLISGSGLKVIGETTLPLSITGSSGIELRINDEAGKGLIFEDPNEEARSIIYRNTFEGNISETRIERSNIVFYQSSSANGTATTELLYRVSTTPNEVHQLFLPTTHGGNRTLAVSVNGVYADSTGSITLSTIPTASYVTGAIFSGSNSALSASYATTASYALNGNTTPSYLIYSGSVTASVNITTGSIFSIQSGSSTFFNINSTGSIGINTKNPTSKLHVKGTDNLVLIDGSGSINPIVNVQGGQNALLIVNDNLSGSLFSINNDAGLPVTEIFSDGTLTIGNSNALSLYTTVKKTISTFESSIYTIPTASYDSVFVDYSFKSGSNARTGQMMITHNSGQIVFTEVSTIDIGTTTNANLYATITAGSIDIRTNIYNSNTWTLKTIIRAI